MPVRGMIPLAEAGSEPSFLSHVTRQSTVTASQSTRVLKKDLG